MHLLQSAAQVWRLSAVMPCRFRALVLCAPSRLGAAEGQAIRLAQLGPDEAGTSSGRDRFFSF
jgi:hypothetical protein